MLEGRTIYCGLGGMGENKKELHYIVRHVI